MIRFRRTRSPGVAVTAICIAALATLAVFEVKTYRNLIYQKPNAAEELLAKYESLRSVLPVGEPIRFEVDTAHADLGRMSSMGRLFLAQYAASPQWIAPWLELRWTVVDSDSSDAVPEFAITNGWTQAADLGNGLRLYRTHWDK